MVKKWLFIKINQRNLMLRKTVSEIKNGQL